MKKKLLIITTGGTLACIQDEKGLVPGLSGQDILAYISDITDLYQVDFLELFQLDSANIQPENWQKLRWLIPLLCCPLCCLTFPYR